MNEAAAAEAGHHEETAEDLRKREARLRLEAKTLSNEIDAAYHLVETIFGQVRHLKQRADYYEQEVERLIDENRKHREQVHVLTMKNAAQAERIQELEAFAARLQADVDRLEKERLE